MTDAPTSVLRTSLAYRNEPNRRIGLRIERAVPGPAVPIAPLSPLAVLCHGFKGFADWGFFPLLSAHLATRGFVVVGVNTSGCGIGTDPMVMDDDEAFYRDSYTRQLEDIERARQHGLGLPGVHGAKECLFGHSRGGGMAVVSSAERSPKSLVTWAAIDGADRFDSATKTQWRADGELRVPNARTGQVHRMSVAALDDVEANAERLDILRAAAELTCPFLAVHGTEDTTVEPAAAQRLAGRATLGRSLLLEGGDHGLGAHHPMDSHSPWDELRPVLQNAIQATVSHFQSSLGE